MFVRKKWSNWIVILYLSKPSRVEISRDFTGRSAIFVTNFFMRTVAYCDENLNCITDNHFGNFEKRIKMRKYPINGVLNVEQLIKDDFLTFTCRVLTKDLVYQQEVHINSSLTCE